MNTSGYHTIADLWWDEPKADLDLVLECSRAISACSIGIVDRIHRKVSSGGLVAVWLFAGSHFTLHTCPEHRYASVDCYTGGETDCTRSSVQIVKALLQLVNPNNSFMSTFRRGNPCQRGTAGTPGSKVPHYACGVPPAQVESAREKQEREVSTHLSAEYQRGTPPAGRGSGLADLADLLDED
jgi:S-adenosylmethionine/arginine decarboxylase-like enzyme